MAKKSTQIGVKYQTFNSFIVAIILYMLVISILFFKIYTREEPKKYTNQKDAFMDVFIVQTEVADIVVAPKQAEKKVEAKLEEKDQSTEDKSKTTNKDSAPKESQPKEEPVKKVVEEKPSVNLSNLFSEVKPIKQPEKSKPAAVQSNKKSDAKTSSTKSASDIFNALQKDITAKAPKAGMTGEYNKYFGDITEIIQQRWVRYKADTNDKAKVTFIIDKFGKLSYNIDEKSLNSEFNNKVKDFLENLKDVDFPAPPDGSAKTISTMLIDKID
ncbi:Tol-Pal system subunit TolA [Campylobacter iguaniorum]|uniref:TonB C-terminal domain-containing protein n=1 Tax=Campylobacter iguaniorum TaxID=1244531 RepID=UPI0007C8D0C7|nr:TonB C-terminal domain-containing protein [Campylobacter iguaniorum]ANE36413.1 Tol-Pal system subunit TolA [Campylobacter iguaniorum]